jgi:DmsE family decaheme c-type cytochrome
VRQTSTRWIRLGGLGLAVALGWALLPASHSGAQDAATTEPAADENAPLLVEEGYVGDEVCLSCHEALREGLTAEYAHTIHAKVLTPETGRNALQKKGCEACHGPGHAHVEAGGGPGTMRSFASDDPSELAADADVCLSCHKGGAQLYWNGSPHDGNEVGCTGCHTLMKNESHRNQLSHAKQRDTCQGCHLIENARQYRNAHMPVREDKMSCTSCHNPHGSLADSLINQHTVNENCYSCHAEKRGPYLWEHPPVNEDCLNCHDPHGTTRDQMLKMGAPRLCQSCHISIFHPSDPRAPDDRFVVGSSCLQCHPNIHGSNHPSGNLFTR